MTNYFRNGSFEDGFRNSLFTSIPNFILKTKNIHENKIANQIDLFSSDDEQDNEIISNVEDWKFEERLSREFEAIGFFISDHPLNQFKEIFNDYKKESCEELWDTEIEMVKYYQKEENYKKLLKGDAGGNLIYKYSLEMLLGNFSLEI